MCITQVKRYAETVDASLSEAIAALVGFSLESQESRKREFFKRLKENPGNGDASDEREVSMEDLFELALAELNTFVPKLRIKAVTHGDEGK